MYMYALVKHTDHISDDHVKNVGVQIFMNKDIRNNIIIKTEQNSSQAHHIKHQNQQTKTDTVDSDEATHYEQSNLDLQSLQNQLLFYLVLNGQ